MKLSGRHQGELKSWGECQAGRGTTGEELPGSIRYLSERARKLERYRWVGAKTGRTVGVRWLNYRSIIPHVFDKLPQKGKNKQSCTVLY